MPGQTAVDVVIVGGGPQGFWLLEILKDAGLSCLLIETNDACGGQSAHAEWLLHRGAVNRAIQLPNKNIPGVDYVRDLNASADDWESLLRKMPNGRYALQPQPTLYGFKLSRNLYWETWCKNQKISVKKQNGFSLHGFSSCYATNEVSVNPEPVFNDWLARFRDDVVLVDDFFPNPTGGIVSSVWLRLPDGSQREVACGAVAMAAGGANRDLLERKFNVPPPSLDSVSWQGMLLAIRGPAGILPPQNYCLIDSGHFLIVSRSGSNQETTMLVSTGDSWTKPNQVHQAGADVSWIQSIWVRLQAIIPALQVPVGLKFRVTTGELRYPTDSLRAAQRPVVLPQPANVVLVAPPRLTLAPHWARLAQPLIESCLRIRAPVQQKLPLGVPPLFKSHYDHSIFDDWYAFRQRYRL